MLVATQWQLVMCLFQKATSCGPLALSLIEKMTFFSKGMSNDGDLDKIQALI